MQELISLPITRLHPHPDNPRKDLGDLTELTDSIKVNGILQNLTVVPDTPDDPDTDYTVIIGHRRLAGATLAGLAEVPCVVATMTPAEQVRTMLMENIQRSDLTVYEQAQGFQMMLDLGGTVSSVAADTGFSETTVRRRVKLLELDPEEFKKSEARGATLFDYMELDKVDDPEEKNKLLKVIGTPDFKAKLQRALDEQKKTKRLNEVKEFLSGFATKVEQVTTGPNEQYVFLTSYDYWADKPLEKPEDADTREYVFTENSWGCSLYRKKDQTDLDKAAEREATWKQERAERDARKAAAEEVSDRCAKLRRDFVMGLSTTTIKRHLTDIVAMAVVVAYELDIEAGDDTLKALGIDADGEDFEVTTEVVAEAIDSPEKALLQMLYLSMESEDGYFDYNGAHTEDEDLDTLYDFLTKLGYEMSEEEKAFQDGSHEIFQVKGTEG